MVLSHSWVDKLRSGESSLGMQAPFQSELTQSAWILEGAWPQREQLPRKG